MALGRFYTFRLGTVKKINLHFAEYVLLNIDRRIFVTDNSLLVPRLNVKHLWTLILSALDSNAFDSINWHFHYTVFLISFRLLETDVVSCWQSFLT